MARRGKLGKDLRAEIPWVRKQHVQREGETKLVCSRNRNKAREC